MQSIVILCILRILFAILCNFSFVILFKIYRLLQEFCKDDSNPLHNIAILRDLIILISSFWNIALGLTLFVLYLVIMQIICRGDSKTLQSIAILYVLFIFFVILCHIALRIVTIDIQSCFAVQSSITLCLLNTFHFLLRVLCSFLYSLSTFQYFKDI